MSRMVIIGNSHAGALKLAIDRAPKRWTPDNVRLFALPRPHLIKMVYNPATGRFGPPGPDETLETYITKINGAPHIDILPEDRLFLVGFGNHDLSLSRLLANRSVDNIREDSGAHRLSQAALSAFLADIADQNAQQWFFTNFKGRVASAVMAPLPADACVAAPYNDPTYGPWRHVIERPAGFVQIHAQLAALMADRLAAMNITLLEQPADSRTTLGVTKSQFTQGSKRLAGNAHPDTDYYHMNADYGELVLTAMQASL